MRLRQLARKIDKHPEQIVSFLAEKGITIENDDNAKVEDLHTDIVIDHFAPEMKEMPVAEIPAVPIINEIEPAAADLVTVGDALPEVSPTEEVSDDSTIELIKAPKVELSGLKVLGKIELPELKKKEVVPAENSLTPAPRLEREDRRRVDQRRQQSYRPNKNPITLQREKEIREEEEKREEERRRQKELKALHYEKKMNEKKATRPLKRIYHEELTEEVPEKVTRPAPKTAWGKFIRWLNT